MLTVSHRDSKTLPAPERGRILAVRDLSAIRELASGELAPNGRERVGLLASQTPGVGKWGVGPKRGIVHGLCGGVWVTRPGGQQPLVAAKPGMHSVHSLDTRDALDGFLPGANTPPEVSFGRGDPSGPSEVWYEGTTV